MLWVEIAIAVGAGAVLGGLLLIGRMVEPGVSTVVVWLMVALGAVAAAALLAEQPLLVIGVGLAVALAAIGLGAPWVVARTDPHLRPLPYWSRLRGDARLRADEARRAAQPEHDLPERRDLSTPD